MLRNQRARAASSSLELEAAEYFKLDPNQLDLSYASRRQVPNLYKVGQSSSSNSGSFGTSRSVAMSSRARANSGPGTRREDSQAGARHRCRGSGQHQQQPSMPRSKAGGVQSEKIAQIRTSTNSKGKALVDRDQSGCQRAGRADGSSGRCDARIAGPQSRPSPSPAQQEPSVVVGSSTTSTNSLPSITSSPSVSPSLVCPHLSLDDILECRQDSSGSPHTIGLCPKCRLDPPPNIHSPLSPQFKPNSRSSSGCSRTQSSMSMTTPKRVRRGYSDQHASYCTVKQTRMQQQQQQQAAQAGRPTMVRHQSDLSRLRDDSLDFCLEPKELRRMQLSPTMRNSVEFIRRNSIESGRVVKIYKNGEPFEKPLRVCILRGEFSTLNHLLDHINSRLLVPSGARYLFHLDGQLVYSVHELKHGSAYVVSGTRSFDYRTSEVVKEQQRREQMNRVSQEQKALISHQLAGAASARRPSGGQQFLDGTGSQADQKRQKAPTAFSAEAPSGGDLLDRNGLDHVRPRPGEQRPGKTQSRPAPTSKRTGPMSFGSIGPRTTKATTASKFSRYDDATGMTPSGPTPTASNQSISLINSERPTMITRAKSELSALPSKKLKKNVTFKDTGRGSSPAISDLSSSGGETTTTTGSTGRRTVSTATLTDPTLETASAAAAGNSTGSSFIGTGGAPKKDLGTNEVGIQVSNSIDGFLIDLPVALPSKGDDSSLADGPAARSRLSQKSRGAGKANAATLPQSGSKRPRQIVTITERQLSHEEMNELNDLSEGDHHDHHEVIIKWGPPEPEKDEPSSEPEPPEPDLVPDRSNTIAIGSSPKQPTETESLISSGRLVTSAVSSSEQADAAASEEAGHWQYPGGDAASSTPAERPVSQIGPNETVRARVTTPTPSLSTGGDNNSLTLSYDTIVSTSASGPQDAAPRSPRRIVSSRHGQLPPKKRAEVMGTLCDGLDAPTRNFRLVWVNGFAINDLYPENSVDVQRLAGSEAAAGGRARGEPQSPGSVRLSPNRGAENQQQLAAEFKPSERYHNWICHSRKHDELVYPAGALIVLWCRWTNEQRYYARHTSNVSCLALASLDSDIAASAQSRDPFERRAQTGGSLIHLWSLSSLDLLRVIDDDQFRSKLIFSMRLKSSRSSGCQLSVAARDERQLFLLEYSAKLATDGGGLESETAVVSSGTSRTSEPGRRNPAVAAGKQQAAAEDGALMMRASRILPSNQLPLFVLRVPKLSGQVGETPTKQQQAEPLISFGRRHFHLWMADVKQKKLRPMQPEQKSARLAELMARANCLCRLSPGEFLLGDSAGNIVMLLIGFNSSQTTTSRAATGAKRTPPSRPTGAAADSSPDSRYSVKAVELVGPSSERPESRPSFSSISCITRISGSLFMSADASCTIRFWRIGQKSAGSIDSETQQRAAGSRERYPIGCEQLSSISLPPDLGFICTTILAQYNLKESVVEFYVVSTSNSILFGSVKLPRASRIAKQANEKEQQPADLLANSSLSVVYEGHETSASGLVADSGVHSHGEQSGRLYFTCSLDCRICKWDGKQLIWKSMLPSPCVSLAVHPLGCVLAVGSVDGTVYILDKTSGLLVSYFPLTPVRINCLAYSRDGSLLAAGCANGSIFMLPVDERGLKYRKVSIFQSPNAVVSLQFSLDNRYMLTSVSHGSYQELILWDLPNFRYMRDDVKLAADKIKWFDSICSGSEDVRAIWENAHLFAHQEDDAVKPAGPRPHSRRLTAAGQSRNKTSGQFVVNLSCHRLIRDPEDRSSSRRPESFVIASDTHGYLRLFRYPAYDIQQGFYAARICSSAVNCCRFLESPGDGHGARSDNPNYFVSTSLDGSICLWMLE